MAGRLLLIGELNDDLTELKMTFEALGLTVEVAPDALAGLEKGSDFQPDLVVTEILTSRLSGFELASRISSGATGFTAPVIFYTEFYRDEKARREVLAKYGAMQYFVRPFQKEALKKSITAHFEDFRSNLAAAGTTESTPESPGRAPEPVVPQLSLAAAAAEQKITTPPSAWPTQAARFSGNAGEAPVRPDVNMEEAPPISQQEESVESFGGIVAEQHGSQSAATVELAAASSVEPTPVFSVDSPTRGDSLLLMVDEPSGIKGLMRSTPLRVAAVVVVLAVAGYLARDLFKEADQEASVPARVHSSSPPATTLPTTTEPPTQATPAPPVVDSRIPPAQESTGRAESEPIDSLASPPPSVSAKKDSRKEETSGVSEAASPGLSVQDVTGSGRGPVLRKMKPIQLSQDALSNLTAKAVVVRVVVDSEGKVTDVKPLNQEGAAVSLPAEALDAIQQWEFSRSRRKGTGEAVKYFSLKVQNPRQ